MHSPEVCERDGIEYYNTGDWVEHCTALVEDFRGNIDLVHYLDDRRERHAPPHRARTNVRAQRKS
jgi:hypothetical protein